MHILPDSLMDELTDAWRSGERDRVWEMMRDVSAYYRMDRSIAYVLYSAGLRITGYSFEELCHELNDFVREQLHSNLNLYGSITDLDIETVARILTYRQLVLLPLR